MPRCRRIPTCRTCRTIINAREEGKTAGEPYEEVSVNQCKAKMARFVQKFANPDNVDYKTLVNMDAGAPYYLQQLEKIAPMEEPFLPIYCLHIEQFDEDLYKQLVPYPQKVIPALDMVINKVFFLKHIQCFVCRNTAEVDIE